MAKFDQLVVTPLLMALGVDEHKKKHSEYRSWAGLKTFFSEKLIMLQEMKVVTDASSAFDLLVSKCASKTKQSMERQLCYVQFYNDNNDMTQEDKDKLELCPLTNSICEGELAQLDNEIKRVGGTQTFVIKHMVRTELFLVPHKY